MRDGKAAGSCYSLTEVDGTSAEVQGFKKSRAKQILTWTAFIFTAFILRLIFHWLPQWYIRCTNSRCKPSEAERFLIKDSSGIYYVVESEYANVDASAETFEIEVEGSVSSFVTDEQPVTVTSESLQCPWFLYKKIKYVINPETEDIDMLRGWEERPVAEILDARPLNETEVEERRELYGENDIPLPPQGLCTLLLKEGLNPFYVFQICSCILWFSDDYYYYASCIVVISAFSLSWQLYEIRKNERALRDTVTTYGMVSVCREVDGKSEFVPVDSTVLVPGDIIEIPREGTMMYCDALLLRGNCIVNESTLTGESVPVTKIPYVAANTSGGEAPQFEVKSASKSVLFCGTSVIQTRNFADQNVIAVVVRTGFRTAKGEMVRAILFPKPMKFKFNQDVAKFVGALSVLAVIGFGVSVYLLLRNGETADVIVKRAFDLITIVVPPALPVAMTVGIVFAQGRLKKRQIFCMNPSAINACGVINVACFDKTGTITEDGLDLWGVIPNGDGKFCAPTSDPSDLPHGPLLETMASCHSLTRIEGELSGDPLDLKMFLSTRWELTEEISEDYCKFEMTIPAVVRPSSSTTSSTTTLLDNDTLPYEIGIIRQFPFSSTLQRMSVIARALNGTHFSVYTKGSPEMIETLCRKETLPRDFHKVLLDYTREGYRVIALAWRPLRVAYTGVMRMDRSQIERQLHFLGLLIMENRLKPESTPVINALRDALIRPVMVTGDNMLTALSVARDCEMIDETDRIIIVSAKPPKQLRRASNAEGPSDATNAGYVVVTNDGNGNFNDLREEDIDSWKDLVQFHYAEDLHRPVTEVTAAPNIHTGRNDERMDGLRPHHDDRKGREHARGLAHWIPFLRRKAESKYFTVSPDIEAQIEATAASERPEGDQGPSQQKPRRPPANALTIRMVDRPDFHLALSGKTWAIIREHCPWLIPKLVVKGTVFARFSPEQKAQLIEALQSVGYFVAMCGDGANDCGALKVAHAGIALSQAEASVASPFTSGVQNISCVPRLIREGRCALATSFGTFKFMMGYSLTQFTSILMLYWVKSSLSDMQFLYIDLFLITSLGITYGYSKAYPTLSVEPPVMRLVSPTTLLSLGLQLLLVVSAQLAAFLYVRSQDWYVGLSLLDDEKYELLNYDNTALFLMSSYQYIFLAVIFSKGPPYRRPMYSNVLFLANVLITVGVNVFLTVYEGEGVLNWISLMKFPSLAPRIAIILGALTNFLLGYLLEMFVEGVSFRRQLQSLKRTLFPRHVSRKDYERIREEIDRMAGVWPPIIRSASIQDIRTEFFAEDDLQDLQARRAAGDRRHRTRSRNISSASSCLDDESQDLNPYDNDVPERTSHSSRPAVMEIKAENPPTAYSKRSRDSSNKPCRRRNSMDATQLREILEQPSYDEAQLDAKQADAFQRDNFQAGADASGFGCAVSGTKSKPSKHPYPARHRSQSSSCEKPKSRKWEPPVVPPHNAGMS
ncbi:hypothetical protein AAHC03_0913 [Spirometra sp. Aus1]